MRIDSRESGRFALRIAPGHLRREGMWAKKCGMSLEARETKHFLWDIPGFYRDIPELPKKFEKKKFVFNVWPLLGLFLREPTEKQRNIAMKLLEKLARVDREARADILDHFGPVHFPTVLRPLPTESFTQKVGQNNTLSEKHRASGFPGPATGVIWALRAQSWKKSPTLGPAQTTPVAGKSFRKQSTRSAKFDPRTLSRKCSRKCTRECTQRCPWKCPRRLRLFLWKTDPL